MRPGSRLSPEAWLSQYDECKELVQEILQIIQERNLQYPDGGPDASRMTATARRKLSILGTQLEQLYKWLDSPEAADLSEPERFRRQDQLHALKNRREQIQQSLKRTQLQTDRQELLSGQQRGPPKETEATAELDNRGLLQLQQHVMQQQDRELEQIEKTVISTKHIAVTIGEEVDLQTRLLEDLDEDVSVTHTRLRAATKRIRHVIKHSSNWKCGLFIFLLIVILTFVIVVGFKLLRLFA